MLVPNLFPVALRIQLFLNLKRRLVKRQALPAAPVAEESDKNDSDESSSDEEPTPAKKIPPTVNKNASVAVKTKASALATKKAANSSDDSESESDDEYEGIKAKVGPGGKLSAPKKMELLLPRMLRSQKIKFEGYDCETLGYEQDLPRGRYLCITTSLNKIPWREDKISRGRMLMNHERAEQDLPGGRYLCITSSGHIYVSIRHLGFSFL